MDHQRDIIIVGAGFAGLSAADTIRQFSPGKSYAVLEGADRAGGRTKTVRPDLGYLDVGGEYLGPTQSYAQTLVQRFNIPTFPTHLPNTQPSVYQDETGILTYFFGSYPVTSDVMNALGTINAIVLSVQASLFEPWNALNASALDDQTVQEWLEANLTTEYGRSLMTLAVRSAFSVEPREMSMLYLAYYAATAGSFGAFENVRGGGDAIRFRFGTGSLIDALVNAIGPENVHYGRRVRRIEQGDLGARVITQSEDGTETWEGRAVIMAMSPVATLKDIQYVPPVPAERRGLAENAPMAATIKCFFSYRTAWWRDRYTGYVLSSKGPADWMMDNTWEDPTTRELKPALMTFIVGDRAREWSKRGLPALREHLLAQICQVFQDERAKSPTDFVGYDWLTDPWSAGCPAGVLRPGVLSRNGRSLRAPFGLLHWAGSESATDWVGGYMNGAIQSGVRAAGEVLNRLR